MTSMGENDCYLSQLSFHWLMNFDKQISPSQMLSIHILLNQHNGQYYIYTYITQRYFIYKEINPI